MSVFAISDLHLSLNQRTNKSMEAFGRRWADYVKKLENGWRAVVTERDTVIVPGDISWGLTTEEATEDLTFLHALPGRKLIGKGNHDFWWQTMSKLEAFKAQKGLTSIDFLYNNAYIVENMIVCGTRGWFYDPSCENMPSDTDFAKISAREAGRLQLSIDAAKRLSAEHPTLPITVFLHFPVIWNGKAQDELLSVLLRNGIRDCYFGHIHGSYDVPSETEHEGIKFTMISADFLNFIPKIIQKSNFLT